MDLLGWLKDVGGVVVALKLAYELKHRVDDHERRITRLESAKEAA